MFSHIFIGISDFSRAVIFYRALMKCLGYQERFCEHDRPWAGWHSANGERPLLLIGKPFDRNQHSVGNGQMVAFDAIDRKTVDLAYNVALNNGGSSEGVPGIRSEYHANFYGAYFRDPDGNKLCVVCNAPDNQPSSDIKA